MSSAPQILHIGQLLRLIVLNDYAEQTLQFDHPEVRIINLPMRIYTVGEKMNAAVALATYDLLFVEDDDDIYLPHRLTFSIGQFSHINNSSDTVVIPYEPSHAKNMFTSEPKYRGSRTRSCPMNIKRRLFLKR